MPDFNLYKYYSEASEHGILVSFQGPLSQDILAELATMIRDRLGGDAVHRRVIHNVFAVFIELSQNILLHSAEKTCITPGSQPRGAGIILIRAVEEGYVITSGNQVEMIAGEQVCQRCATLNKLDSAALKQQYRRQLHSKSEVGSGSVHLGLMEIARRSDQQLYTQLVPLDSDMGFLKISTIVNRDAGHE